MYRLCNREYIVPYLYQTLKLFFKKFIMEEEGTEVINFSTYILVGNNTQAAFL